MNHPGCRTDRLLLAAMLLAVGVCARGSALSQSRVTVNGHPVFLSGSNIAWVNFARDIGPDYTNLTAFQVMFDSVRASGGNSMRFWLHTNGASSPQFDATGHVTGPGTNTISDLTAIVNLAWERRVSLILCLWSFDMLRISYGSGITDRARLMLSDTSFTRPYIQNALLPMVSALKGHPGIAAWEVFNEAEGMSEEHGWDFTYHVPMRDIQRFVNWVAGAIHRADTSAHVTTGAWSFIAQSDVSFPAKTGEQALADLNAEEKASLEEAFEERYNAPVPARAILSRFSVLANYNYYRDDRLIGVGADPDGTLDYYTVHYYSWAGTALSPFHHPYEAWQLDKPIAVAEFYIEDTFGIPYARLYDTLFTTGYAGAMSWQWYQNSTQQPRTKMLMRDLYSRHAADLDVDPVPGRIYTFSAWPTLLEAGDTSTLTWATSQGSAVTLNGAPVSGDGSLLVAPNVTTTYRLLATGMSTDSARVTVQVFPTGKVLSFGAFPMFIAKGESSHLRWSTSRGSTVTLNAAPVNEDDSLLVAPDTTTTYTLAATGTLHDTARVTITVAPVDQINRALNRPVVVTTMSTDPRYSDPSHAVDGSFSTEWHTLALDAQWIMVDLGQIFQLKKVIFGWGTNYATMWRLGASDDNVAWRLVRSTITGTGGIVTLDTLSGTGRYIKLMLDRRSSTTSGFALRELQVYGLLNPQSAVSPGEQIPDAYALHQNYPNPFNPATKIQFTIGDRQLTVLRVYDVLGREVTTLVNEVKEPGAYAVHFDASNLASGVYYYRLQAGDFVQTRKLVFLR